MVRSASDSGLRALTVALGVFFIAMSANKIAWLGDAAVLVQRFESWLPHAAPGPRWYLEAFAIPGAAVLARAVPLGEFCIGLAFVLGVWTRVVAAVAFLMVLNFQYATSALYAWTFLREGTGLPVLGGLLALAIGGRGLPFSMSRR